MPTIETAEPGDIYVLAPLAKEGEPRPLIRLNKRATTLNQIKSDIRDFGKQPSTDFSIRTGASFSKISLQPNYTLFFIPAEKKLKQVLRDIQRAIGSPVEINKTIEPLGFVLFLHKFVRPKQLKL